MIMPAPYGRARSARPASRSKSGCIISRSLPAVDPYLASAVSFARSALGGAGVVMVHYTRAQGLTDLPTEADAGRARRARCRRARRLCGRAARPQSAGLWAVGADPGGALARGARGNPAALHPRHRDRPPSRSRWSMPSRPPPRTRTSTCSTARRPCSGARPNCSRAIADASARTGRRVHMHLLETRYQRHWADETIPAASSAISTRSGCSRPASRSRIAPGRGPNELELIAERGATISANTSSNLHLHSGIAPVAEMVRRGCRVALGLDGATLDEDDDALRELRLAHLLHRGTGFRGRCQPRRDADHDAAQRPPLGHQPGRRRRARGRRAGRYSPARLGRRRRRTPARPISIRASCCSRAPPRITSAR